MRWILPHRASDDVPAEETVIEAETPGEAIEQLRQQLPDGHKILYVMRQD
jgi:hypothetical protein